MNHLRLTRTPRLVVAALLTGGLAAAGVADATPGRRAVAPGRVVFPVNGGITSANVDGGRATEAVALPNGETVLVGGAPAQKGFYAAELTSTGSLDPSFGSKGIARVTLASQISPTEVLEQPDGKLVVIGSTSSGGQTLAVVRLNADGGVDQTFGTSGVAVTGIAPACDGCTTAALAPDGDIVLTGETSNAPGSPGNTNWALTRLTPSGQIDQTFGHEGIATISSPDAGGFDVAVLADDDIITLGLANISSGKDSVALLTRITPMGLPELDYDGGTPAELPPASGAFAMLVYPDGSAVIGGSTALFRYNSVGEPDDNFANNGVARVGTLPFPLQLLPAAGGAVIAVGPAGGSTSSLRGLRVTAAGSIDPSLGGPTGAVVTPSFGGGGSSFVSSLRPRPLPPLTQNSFIAGPVVARPDGSYLAVGGVSVSQPTGEGEGRSIFDFAAVGLSPSFTPDTGLGGRAARLTLKLSVPGQAAGTAAAKHGIGVRIDASAPGLARVTIKAEGRVIAQSVLPIFGAGPRSLPVELTAHGATVVGGHANIRVTATATVRNLLAVTAHASASGMLR
jgi:uncharacterized delta-60 repeat protein